MQSKFNIPANFSERLSLAISRDGRTKSQIAEAAGVKPPALSRWLAGSLPDHENARDLAATLNVSVNWLLNGEDNRNGSASAAWGREEPPNYRGRNATQGSAPDLLHACTVMLGSLAHASTVEAFGYGVQGFEEIWERFKTAKQQELE